MKDGDLDAYVSGILIDYTLKQLSILIVILMT